MRKLIVVVILIGVATASWTYEAPSDEELAGYWEGLTREERLAELRKLDEIEGSRPDVDIPQMVVVQTQEGWIYAYYNEPVIVDVAGHLRYSFNLPTARVQGNPERSVMPWALGGFTAGVVATVVAILLVR